MNTLRPQPSACLAPAPLIGDDFDAALPAPAPAIDQPLPADAMAPMAPMRSGTASPSVAESLLKMAFVLPRAA